jgi:hypothetical protein
MPYGQRPLQQIRSTPSVEASVKLPVSSNLRPTQACPTRCSDRGWLLEDGTHVDNWGVPACKPRVTPLSGAARPPSFVWDPAGVESQKSHRQSALFQACQPASEVQRQHATLINQPRGAGRISTLSYSRRCIPYHCITLPRYLESLAEQRMETPTSHSINLLHGLVSPYLRAWYRRTSPVEISSGIPYRSFQNLHNGNDLLRFRFRFRIKGTAQSFSEPEILMEQVKVLRANSTIRYCVAVCIAICAKLWSG